MPGLFASLDPCGLRSNSLNLREHGFAWDVFLDVIPAVTEIGSRDLLALAVSAIRPSLVLP